MRDRHVDICRQDGDEKSDQTPRGCLARRWKEQPEASEYLCDSTDVDDSERRGQRWWHDPEINLRSEKVKAACNEEENGEEDATDHLLTHPHLLQRHKKSGRVWSPPPFTKCSSGLCVDLLLGSQRVAMVANEIVCRQHMRLLFGDQLSNGQGKILVQNVGIRLLGGILALLSGFE
jgi:hypothetical protein